MRRIIFFTLHGFLGLLLWFIPLVSGIAVGKRDSFAYPLTTVQGVSVNEAEDTSVVFASETATLSATPTPTFSPVTPTSTPIPTIIPTQVKVIVTTAPVQSTPPSSGLWSSINAYRQSHGASILAHDGELCGFSNKRLSELIRSGSLNHNGFSELLNEYVSQKQYAKIGETLAQGYTDPNEIVRHWDESEAHRVIIQDGAYNRGCDAQGNGFSVLIVGKK